MPNPSLKRPAVVARLARTALGGSLRPNYKLQRTVEGRGRTVHAMDGPPLNSVRPHKQRRRERRLCVMP